MKVAKDLFHDLALTVLLLHFNDDSTSLRIPAEIIELVAATRRAVASLGTIQAQVRHDVSCEPVHQDTLSVHETTYLRQFDVGEEGGFVKQLHSIEPAHVHRGVLAAEPIDDQRCCVLSSTLQAKRLEKGACAHALCATLPDLIVPRLDLSRCWLSLLHIPSHGSSWAGAELHTMFMLLPVLDSPALFVSLTAILLQPSAQQVAGTAGHAASRLSAAMAGYVLAPDGRSSTGILRNPPAPRGSCSQLPRHAKTKREVARKTRLFGLSSDTTSPPRRKTLPRGASIEGGGRCSEVRRRRRFAPAPKGPVKRHRIPHDAL